MRPELPPSHPANRPASLDPEIARTAALDAARAQAAALAHAALGDTPLWEMLSWPVKEEAARRGVAGNPTTEDLTLLKAETDQTGERTLDLAHRVIRKADAFRLLAGQLTGLRRAAEKSS